MKARLAAIYALEPAASTKDMLEQLVGRPVEVRIAPALEPVAAAKNAALSATEAPYAVFLDEQQGVGPSFLTLACRLLDRDSALEFVTSWASGAPLVNDPAPRDLELAGLFSRPLCAHVPTVYRVDAWRSAGGFDEALRVGEELDLLARRLAPGRGAAIPEAILRVRPWGSAPDYDEGIVRQSAELLLARHAARFSDDLSPLLLGKERIIRELFAVRAEADARFRALEEALRESQGELARVTSEITRHRRGG